MRNLLQIKTLKYLMLSILVTFSFSSCNNDISNIIDAEDENKITLSTYINENNTATRMSGTSFQINDEIGVYSVAYQNNNLTEGDILNSYAPNVKHIYDESNWTMPTGTSLPWAGNNTKVTLYAYYPYNESATKINSKDYPFTVNSDQQLIDSYAKSDFLWAKSEATTPTKNKVPLSFTHQMSKIVINVKSDKDFTEEEVNNFSVNLLNLYLDGTIDLSTGTASIKSNAETKSLKPYKRTNPTSGYGITFEAILFPQNVSISTGLFSIKSADGTTPHIYRMESGMVFSPKKQYTFNISITKTGISITTDEIKDWETTPDINGNINKPVKKAVDISNINWDLTRVYKIMDNGIQVGELTKEYLYSTVNETPEAQTIVAYSMQDDGTVYNEFGFAAQVMQDTPNIDNEYSPDVNQNIHGGNVWWVSGNTVYHDKGDKPLINKIQLNRLFEEASDDAVYTLTLEPDLATDIDGNRYGIVKIGKQYWMRENLKVEHYNNGAAADIYYYNNDAMTNKNKLGGLYTWQTVVSSNGLAPEGWHIPDEDELRTLATYLSGTTALPNSGKKLKATTMWNPIGNNISGFGALPGGRKIPGGGFSELNTYGQWWTTTEYNAGYGMRMYIGWGTADVVIGYLDKNYTQSIRCLKN